KLNALDAFNRYILRSQSIALRLDKTRKAIAVLEGKPSTTALSLLRWRRGRNSYLDKIPDEINDDHGIIWYSPLLPFDRQSVKIFNEMVTEICLRHQIEPLVTLTSMGAGLFDATIPILFDNEDEDQKEQAWRCYETLFSECRAYGFVPYRYPHLFVDKIVSPEHGFWALAEKIKNA